MVQSHDCANGRVRTSIPSAARACPALLRADATRTRRNCRQRPTSAVNPPAARVLSLLQDDEVHYNGQPIALVVAETLEQAALPRRLCASSTTTQAAAARFFDAAKATALHTREADQRSDRRRLGRCRRRLAGRADAKIDQVYTTPMEHHNPMEPHATIAQWDGEAS